MNQTMTNDLKLTKTLSDIFPLDEVHSYNGLYTIDTKEEVFTVSEIQKLHENGFTIVQVTQIEKVLSMNVRFG